MKVDSLANDLRARSLELLLAVLDHCDEAVIAYSLDGRIKSWNRAAERLYGFTAAEQIGVGASDLAPPQRREEVDAMARSLASGRTIAAFATERVGKSGDPFAAEVSGFPIHTADGEVVGFATLERRLSDRGRRGRAPSVPALAQPSGASTMQLLAYVHDDLSARINKLVGMSATALDQRLEPELRDCLATIRRSAESLRALLAGVAELLAADSIQNEHDEAAFSIRKLIDGVIEARSATANALGLDLVCSIAPETPENFRGDASRLRQVVSQLVGHALDSPPSGNVLIDVEPTQFQPQRCKLRFRVFDTRFAPPHDCRPADAYGATRSTHVEGESTPSREEGAELSIVRHLLASFECPLQVDRLPSDGTCFSFTISLALDGSTEPRTADPAAATPLRILLVEDVPANRKIVHRTLDRRGHAVTIAVNGQEGIDAFENGDFDLVLMDIQMPVMDGIQATQAIREIEQRRGVQRPLPIIALTAHTLGANRERYLHAGMNDCLGKPVDVTRLIEVVEAAGGRSRRPHTPCQAAASDARATPSTHNAWAFDGAGERRQAIDLTNALARLRGDQKLLVELIDLFGDDYVRLLAEIREAVRRDAMSDVRRAAHNLKGLAASFDAGDAVATALQVEAAASDGGVEGLPRLVERLESDMNRLNQSLQKFRARGDG